jgi:pyrimidine operon attenuation protein/uracil phosphoribosyltransferase
MLPVNGRDIRAFKDDLALDGCKERANGLQEVSLEVRDRTVRVLQDVVMDSSGELSPREETFPHRA